MKAPRTRIASTIAAHTFYDGISKAYSKQIAALLLSDGRVDELDSLLRDVQADWALHGYVEVLARSAHPLSEEVRKDIRAQVKKLYPKADTVVVTEVADPAVIGGVQLDLADRQLNLSVAAKLNRFKQLVSAGKE
jgi:F-type H+-transporting ATPase subunit O